MGTPISPWKFFFSYISIISNHFGYSTYNQIFFYFSAGAARKCESLEGEKVSLFPKNSDLRYEFQLTEWVNGLMGEYE